MPAPPEARRRRLGCAMAFLLPGCLLLSAAAAAAMAPILVQPRVGQASPDLSVVERTALALHLASRLPDLDRPAGRPEASLELIVEPGATADEVLARLHAAGIVADPDLLRSYLRYLGWDRLVEAGGYELNGAMTVAEVAAALQAARAPEIVFTIPEGWRREQIADSLPAAGFGFDGEEFLRATERVDGLPPGLDPGFALPSLEGFLFPDTYRLELDTSADELAVAMVGTFDRRVGPGLRAEIQATGLGLVEAVILASIVEREAVLQEERPLIASVFLNRLGRGMRLETDPTVQYALGRQADGGWWKSPLSLADLRVDSPFNTYLFPGLPPAPICSPGLASLEAVARPTHSDYLYFRAACDASGRHVFSRTLEEHIRQACP
ncbi:MAG: endolytic transglycosylase MltG [Anaerolineales bacterium]